MTAKKQKRDIYQEVTDRIIEMLEEGTVPWQRPWSSKVPTNAISKKSYRGINIWLLSHLPYRCHLYGTYKQITSMGGKVKKGEKGHLITFWRFLETVDKKGKKDNIPLLRHYVVFNLEQTTGLEEKIEEAKEDTNPDFQPIKEAHDIAMNYINSKAGPALGVGPQACYQPKNDIVLMPEEKDFKSEEAYYSTLFHEIGHSTGHKDRLDRWTGAKAQFNFGSHDYSKEELVAEFSASFLRAEAGISRIEEMEQSASYIKSWLKALRDDKKLLISAAGKAQKAVDLILDRKPEIKDKKTKGKK